MREMPTAVLPADSFYEYVPDRDEWIVTKKSGNKKLSKKDYGLAAICPACGDWKGTKYSPEELKELDWECDECMAKHPNEIKQMEEIEEMEEADPSALPKSTIPEDLPAEDRGQKELSTSDPEYAWLMRLIDTVTQAGVPAYEIKNLAQAFPFRTVDDAGDLAAKIWTLATEKYNIPRDWLTKKLPERRAFLNKKAYEGGYPTENDATTWGTAAPGTYAYQPMINHDAPTGLREGDNGEPIVICPKCKSDKIDKESSPAKCQVCGTDFVPKPDRGSDDQTVNDYSQNYFWGPNDLGRSHQHSPADTGYAPAGTEDYDGVSSNVMMSSFKSFMHKQSSLNKVAHCGPCSALKMEVLHVLIDLYYKDNNLFPEEVLEELSVAATELKLDNFNDILESVIEEYLEGKSEKVGDKLPKLKNLLIALKDIAPKLGKEIEVVDKRENVEKEADLKEYSNWDTKSLNDFIISHGDILFLVTELAKIANFEVVLVSLLKDSLRELASTLGIDPMVVRWNELAHAYYSSVKGGEDTQRMFQKKEPIVNFDIENLPTLNKEKKLDELLEQLSTETNPQKQEQIKQHIERIKNASLNKQANPPSRFWIAPDGKEFPVPSAGHGAWMQQHKDILKQYGIPFVGIGTTWPQMIEEGWVRISNEPSGSGFQIELKDFGNTPNFLDDFVAKNFKQGDTILLGSPSRGGIEITDPFPTLQKAVNKELMHSKQASLLDEVLDQTTQDAIASEYGPSMLIALRFYNDAVRYGQTPQRAMAYALEEVKRMHRPIQQKDFLEVLDTYF